MDSLVRCEKSPGRCSPRIHNASRDDLRGCGGRARAAWKRNNLQVCGRVYANIEQPAREPRMYSAVYLARRCHSVAFVVVTSTRAIIRARTRERTINKIASCTCINSLECLKLPEEPGSLISNDGRHIIMQLFDVDVAIRPFSLDS